MCTTIISEENRVPRAGVPAVTRTRNHVHSCQREENRPCFYDGRTLLRSRATATGELAIVML